MVDWLDEYMLSYWRPKFGRLINANNCTEIIININYIRKISIMKYKFKTDYMTRLKKNKSPK